IFEAAEETIKYLNIPRNAYINKAVDFYTKIQNRKLLKDQLLRESQIVAGNSLVVLKEFEIFEDETTE
ncbi:MAG: hypothetical protein KAH95_17510, partial [Spirochaetales bacterium]|nr:hypothetical protein [Spirochaetales bacterium]